MNTLEILAPCGGIESVAAALHTGADAVYLGAKKFSARHNAVNFSDEALKTAVWECHRHGVLVYLAMNTILRDDELREAADILKLACDVGIDGLIAQDISIIKMVKDACPTMPLHASTQMTLHTPSAVRAAKKLGMTRVVAAREMTLESIKDLCSEGGKIGVEIEAFAHGALCMSVSGQCYLSAMIGGRSANRGLCAGACRLPFSAEGNPCGEEFALSLKDMSYCGRVAKLIAADVKSLKIEGRMKRPEYVAAATNALKSAALGEDFDSERLRAVFSRSGFTDGYLDGKTGAPMFGARVKEDVVSAESALPELRRLYDKCEKRFLLNMKFTALAQEKVSFWASDGTREVTILGDRAELAKNRATTEEAVREQLSKLGGTLYDLKKLEICMDNGLFLPISKINELRRAAVDALDEKRAAELSAPKSFDGSRLWFDFPHVLSRKFPELRVRVNKTPQLSEMELRGESVVLPLSEAQAFCEAGYSPERAVLALPRFDLDEKKTAERLKIAKNLGFTLVECGNIGQIELVRSLGLRAQGGFGLNVANSLSAMHYAEEGLDVVTLSPELRASQLSSISCGARTGFVAYGRLPLMLTRNCPIAAQLGSCRRCTHELTDRTGAKFPILCHRELGIFELLNSRPIWLADKLSDFNLDFADLYFTVESPRECARILGDYRQNKPPNGDFTRGLYYRGVE